MRILATLCLMLATAVSSAQIIVPSTIDQYYPIVVESSEVADGYTWTYPEPLIGIQTNNGRTVHIWGPPGKYRVQLTTIKIDWKAEKFEQKAFTKSFTVLGVAPGPTPPGPTPPAPTAFKSQLKEALAGVDAGFRSFAKDLGANYRITANKAKRDPSGWDSQSLINRVSQQHGTDLSIEAIKGWKAFWPKVSTAMDTLKLDPNDLDGYIAAFLVIADVLEGK
jgi:hypothetical protein